MPAPADWHPEDVKAAIRKTGISLEALGRAGGFSAGAVAIALRRPIPRVEALIARHLGLTPQQIWPSRYDDQGKPRRGFYAGTKRSADRCAGHRQESQAA